MTASSAAGFRLELDDRDSPALVGDHARFDKLGANYQATLDLVEMLDWLRAVPDGHYPQDRT
ncbi:hypothetical protein [Krasilnikovia sp. M28-CT-15]|uniref:hypothetical protein n=1 Tax=Krasilnikovia sp. M28-CT-15 TaxID=3373540 RepID=UPI003876BF8C